MNTYIGIDLGTSSVKLLLVAADGTILNTASADYKVYYPMSGYSEQNPYDWYDGAIDGIKRLLNGFNKSDVKGISFGGQMHGLVALDRNGAVIRPAILWNDGRTEKQTAYLNGVIGKRALSDMTANIAFAGFTAPKLLWLKENEPENYAKIAKIMLPKDYLAYRLCGGFSTDYSDAAGMLLLDVKNKKWSREMCNICGVKEEWLPKLYESYDVCGTLSKEIARETGLSDNVRLAAGAGDNAAAAIGTGTAGDNACNISLGTSGTVFITSHKFSVDENNALHSFCHADGGYHLMGCILSAASCNSWWVKDILRGDFKAEQAGADAFTGANDVFFMPYLMGERSPHNDVNARAAFIGMRPDTDRTKMTLAILEWVMFALKDCFEIAKANGVTLSRTKICGGGAKSQLWKQIAADILGIGIDTLETEEGPAYGAALLAMTACGEYKTVNDAAAACVKVKDTVLPRPDKVKKYENRYAVYRELYPALKNVFTKI